MNEKKGNMFMSPAAATKRPKINVNRIFVIIPAAGLSTRMESDVNKQIMEIDGVSVIERTLGAFQKFSDNLSSSGVSLRAVVVTSEELVYRINGLCRYNKFEFVQQVVTGGKTRMESVWRGIEALADLPFPPGDNDIVFIHDGARCLIDQPTLERCLEGAMKYDICAAAVPVKSTIKQTKMDILDEIPSVDEATPKKPSLKASAKKAEPEAPVAPSEPEAPVNFPRAAFEDREPAAPSKPTFTSLTSLMESKKASEQSNIFAAREEVKEPSPFEAPSNDVDEDGYRMDKVFVSDNPTDNSSNKNPVLGLGMDYISKLPSLADRLGGAVMGKLAKEEQKRNAAAEEAAKKKKAEAPKPTRKNTPYVRPDSPFKRIDINEITVDDDDEEPEVAVEEPVVEEEVPNSPFKRIDTSKITVDDDYRPATRPAARPPVTRPASAVRPAARPPVTRPASAARPAAAARPERTERPVPAGRPAARPATAERANQAGRPAAVGRPGSAPSNSPFKNNNASPEVVSTPDRDELMEVQTPQVFRFDKLIQSYVNGIKHNIEATDDTSLAEAIHLKVHLVEGSYTNIKITTKEDIDYAEMILKRQASESAT